MKRPFAILFPVPSDDRAEKSRFRQILVECVEAEDDILDAAAAIRRADRNDRRAVIHQTDLDAAAVGQHEPIDRRAIGEMAEGVSIHGGDPGRRQPRQRDEQGRDIRRSHPLTRYSSTRSAILIGRF
jgi:hypothetical protein